MSNQEKTRLVSLEIPEAWMEVLDRRFGSTEELIRRAVERYLNVDYSYREIQPGDIWIDLENDEVKMFGGVDFITLTFSDGEMKGQKISAINWLRTRKTIL